MIYFVDTPLNTKLANIANLKVNTNDTLYKVCIGAYRDKNNALNQVKLAKDKGFKDAYII